MSDVEGESVGDDKGRLLLGSSLLIRLVVSLSLSVFFFGSPKEGGSDILETRDASSTFWLVTPSPSPRADSADAETGPVLTRTARRGELFPSPSSPPPSTLSDHVRRTTSSCAKEEVS